MNTVLMQKLCCIFATLWGIFTPLIKPRAVCYYACFGESIIQIPGTFDISTDRQLLLWCVGSFAVWDLYVTSSSRFVFLVFIKLKNAIKRVTITQQRSYLRWSWKFYDTVATATFDRNGKTQPTAEALHVLQLKHSGAHKVLRPGLFDLRHRFEAAEVKLLFQNLTETRVLHWFTAHPLQVALAIAGLARHGINKLGQAASGEPNTEFHSLNVLPEGPWQQCWEWDHRASQHFVRRLFSSCTTYNLLTCAFEKLTEPPQELNGATARVSASKCTNPWYISEGTEASFLDAFSKFWQYRRWERQLTKMPGIRNRKLKTCLQCLGIRLSNSSRASFFNAKSFSTGKRSGPWRAQDPECCDSRRVYNQCNAVLDLEVGSERPGILDSQTFCTCCAVFMKNRCILLDHQVKPAMLRTVYTFPWTIAHFWVPLIFFRKGYLLTYMYAYEG